jgi:hypothetical protein
VIVSKLSSVLIKALRKASPVPSFGKVPTKIFDKKGKVMEISIVYVIYSNIYMAKVNEKGLLLALFV